MSTRRVHLDTIPGVLQVAILGMDPHLRSIVFNRLSRQRCEGGSTTREGLNKCACLVVSEKIDSSISRALIYKSRATPTGFGRIHDYIEIRGCRHSNTLSTNDARSIAWVCGGHHLRRRRHIVPALYGG